MELELVRAHLLQNGVMLSNRFLITIPLPIDMEKAMGNTSEQDGDLANFFKTGVRVVNILMGGNSTSKRGLQVMCTASQIPGLNIETSDTKMNGHDVSTASGISYDLLSTRFLSSQDAYEKRVVDQWLGYIVNRETKRAQYYDKYITDIMVEALDPTETSQYGCTLVEAYPKLMTPLNFDKTQSNAVMEFEVQWKFLRIEYEVQQSSSNLLGKTTAGKMVQSLSNGDLESAAYSARKLVVAQQNGTLDTKMGGEAYNAISKSVNNTAGVTAKDAENMVATINGTALKTVTSNEDKGALQNLTDKITGK